MFTKLSQQNIISYNSIDFLAKVAATPFRLDVR